MLKSFHKAVVLPVIDAVEVQRQRGKTTGVRTMDIKDIRAAVSGHIQEYIFAEGTRFTAVLIPLLECGGQPHILFEVRSSDVAQAGEVSFPGGHLEAGESAQQAAVRETCEELLLREEQIEVLAPMHRMTDRGMLVIDSFIGVLHDYDGRFLKDEVARIFTVPLSWFIENEPETYPAEMVVKTPDNFPFELIRGGKNYPFLHFPRNFYFYRVQGEVIWGITAELLYNALRVMRK